MKTNDLKPGQLLTLHEAAQLMAVSERTLWQLTKDGKVAAVRLGRCVGGQCARGWRQYSKRYAEWKAEQTAEYGSMGGFRGIFNLFVQYDSSN